MTHISEREFADLYVEPHLQELYGAVNVEKGRYIKFPDESYGFADFWVEVGDLILAIECENDAHSVREGVSQAREYAMTHERAIPVVYIPADHTARSRVNYWRTQLPIIEVET